jgi:hypothetical protein
MSSSTPSTRIPRPCSRRGPVDEGGEDDSLGEDDPFDGGGVDGEDDPIGPIDEGGEDGPVDEGSESGGCAGGGAAGSSAVTGTSLARGAARSTDPARRPARVATLGGHGLDGDDATGP